MFSINGFFGIWIYSFAEWTSTGSENSWICNQYLNIWPMISFCCCNISMFLLIYFVWRGRTAVSCGWIIYNFSLAFPNFRYLPSHTPSHHVGQLQYPGVSWEIWTTIRSFYWSCGHSPSWETFFPFDMTIFIKECRNHLSLMLLLILCA